MNKKLGEEIDKDIHHELLASYIEFIETFSPVLSKAEEYKMNIVSENIIDPSDINRNKLDTINRLHNLLIEMVPKFIEFAQIEYELEKFYE
jgi:hypothetical protein